MRMVSTVLRRVLQSHTNLPLQPTPLIGREREVGAVRETSREHLSTAESGVQERHVTIARAQLDKTAFAATWAEGRAMTLEQAIAYGLEEMQEA